MKIQKHQLIERCAQEDCLPTLEEYRLIVKQYTDILLERNELRARVAELEARASKQRGKWCDPVVTNE